MISFNWITNHLTMILRYSLSRFWTKDTYKKFREPVDPSDWKEHTSVALVNAFYNPSKNYFEFPAGILQGVFFKNGRPKYMNFGGIGTIIGHEITHGFDDQGRQRDYTGNYCTHSCKSVTLDLILNRKP